MSMFLPYVHGKGEGATDIISRLLEDRIVILNGEVNEMSAQLVVTQLLYLDAMDKQKPIHFYINSCGGSVTDGLAIVDIMNLISAPVYTVVMGQACSMGAFILSCGEKGHRYALPNAEVMIHQVLAGCGGQATDIAITTNWILKTKEKLTKILAENCGKTYEEVYKDCERDHWLSSEDALEYGIIDKILTK